MKTTRTNPLYKVAVGGAILFLIGRMILRKGEAVRSLNANVTKVDWNRSEKTFVVFVRIINPSNSSIQLSSIVGDVLWNGVYGATMSYLTKTELKPLEEQTLQIPVKPNLEWTSLILNIIKQGKKAFNGTFEIKGVVNAEGLVVPFEYKNKIELFS
jgi:LEA14-like dessication related protein